MHMTFHVKSCHVSDHHMHQFCPLSSNSSNMCVFSCKFLQNSVLSLMQSSKCAVSLSSLTGGIKHNTVEWGVLKCHLVKPKLWNKVLD